MRANLVFSLALLAPGCAPREGPAHPVEAPSTLAASGVTAEATTPVPGPSIQSAEAVIRGPIHAGVKRCFQEGLRADPSQGGHVVVRIHIKPDGEVDDGTITSNTGLTSAVADCIVQAAKRARFEPPGDSGSTISIPFNLEPHRAPDAGAM